MINQMLAEYHHQPQLACFCPKAVEFYISMITYKSQHSLRRVGKLLCVLHVDLFTLKIFIFRKNIIIVISNKVFSTFKFKKGITLRSKRFTSAPDLLESSFEVKARVSRLQNTVCTARYLDDQCVSHNRLMVTVQWLLVLAAKARCTSANFACRLALPSRKS